MHITRPTLATGRLALTPQGRVRYTLKTPYRDGTTQVVLEPLDFMARLAAAGAPDEIPRGVRAAQFG